MMRQWSAAVLTRVLVRVGPLLEQARRKSDAALVPVIQEAAAKAGVALRSLNDATDWAFWTGERYPRHWGDTRPSDSVVWIRSLFTYEMDAEDTQEVLAWLRDAFAANPCPGEDVVVMAVERFVEAQFDE